MLLDRSKAQLLTVTCLHNENVDATKESFRLAEDHIGRPAHRIVLKYVKDVSARFNELRFGTAMLTDHNPGAYEEALDKLRIGMGLKI